MVIEDQQQTIDQQIEHERAARVEAANAIGAVFTWAHAAAMAFPENIGVLAWQPGATLELRYNEHDGILILGVRAADGTKHALHAVSADRTSPETFGRPLDSILRAALEAVPLSSEQPTRMQ